MQTSMSIPPKCIDTACTTPYRYFLSGSNLSMASIDFSYMVNTIPPLSINRASLGTAPDQNVKMPSFLKIDAAHAKLFL
jgi:hypothetical protein